MKMRSFVAVVVMLSIVALPGVVRAVDVGQPAPTFNLASTTGGDIALGDYRGKKARLADRIFKGARPGDVPVEQPTKFELVINVKSATALGIAVPPAMRLRADRLIQ